MFKSLKGIDPGVWLGFFWFLCIIDGFYTWFFSSTLVLEAGLVFMFASTILLFNHGGIQLTENRVFPILLTLVIFVYVGFFKRQMMNSIVTFIPMWLFLLWKDVFIIQFYRLFRTFVIFFAICGVIMGIINIVGLLSHFPYLEFEARDNVQALHGNVCRLYGVCVFSADSYETSMRVCGFLREGGHFAVFLGLLYIVERTSMGVRNLWLLLCGILTFSSNFIVCVILAEIVALYEERAIGRTMKYIMLAGIVLLVTFSLLPDALREQLVYLAFGRNLEAVLGSIGTGDFEDALNLRANDIGELYYYQFANSADTYTYLFGLPSSIVFEDIILSDYRYLIMTRGIVYLVMIFVLIFSCSKSINKKLSIALLLFAILILTHRAWMLSRAYVYVLIILATVVYKNKFDIINLKN